MNFHRRLTAQPARSNLRLRANTLVFLVALAGAPLAQADTIFNVNTLADQIDQDVSDGLCETSVGTCSLRAAIMQANHLTGPITTRIRLLAATYGLTRPITGSNGEDSGDLNFTVPLTAGQAIVIEGATAATSVINANQIDSVMSVAVNRVVTLSRVTVRGGFRVQTLAGGIYSEGVLTLLDCVVEGNTGNFAPGGITSYGSLDIRRSIVRANTGNAGGAVYAAGAAIIRDSILYGNAARYGGGIAVSSNAAASVYVINSTISGNTATADGGGIDAQGQTFLYNTSIIANDANHDNDTDGGTGGGVNNVVNRRIVAVNSLIARNTVRDSSAASDCKGDLEVYGWNLLSDFTNCTFSGNGAAARGTVSGSTIGPLADNGGPTPTHALVASSEAIDTTLPQGCINETGALLSTDQRGAPRIAGARCDVGAYEFGSTVPPADTVFKNGFD